MDPNNPLRGPRRAARRGEQALRYDRLSYPEAAELVEASRRRLGHGARGGANDDDDDGSLLQNDRLVMQRMREEIWNNLDETSSDDDDNDGNAQQADSDDDNDAGLAGDPRRVPRDSRTRYPGLANNGTGVGFQRGGGRLMEFRDGDLVEADTDEEEEEEDDNGGQDGEGVEMEDGDDEEGGMEGDNEEEEEENEDGEDGEEFFDFPGDLPDGDEAGLLAFDPVALGLKEINNLAHFSVSSHKPGNGVEELLSDDLDKFWQSDGPQPHLLTIHFLRRVEIRAIRLYVDYNQDESYTPTSLALSAGTGHHDLLEFSTLALNRPVGWQDIDLGDAGGGDDGHSLCCWIVQVRVRENHQNGKDTHIRGIKLYGIDEHAVRPASVPLSAGTDLDALAELKMKASSGANPLLDADDYMLEQLLLQSPERMAGHPDRPGRRGSFFREMEIR